MRDGFSLVSLFSGIGGFELAAHSLGIPTACCCECEPYAVRVLRRHFPGVPVFPDVKELTGARVREIGRFRRVRIILTAGFPCQDISYAGLGAGLEGERSGLFFEVVRLIGELGPDFVLLENVAALLTRGADAVLGALADVGYDAVWGVVRASDVGAPHRRERIWVVAYPQGSADGASIAARVLRGLTPFGRGVCHTPRAEGFDAGGGDEHSSLPQQAKSETWPTCTASDAWAEDLDRDGIVGKHNLGLGTAVRAEAPESARPTPVGTDSLGARNATADRPGGNGRHHGGTTLTDALILTGEMLHPREGTARPSPHANCHTGAGSHGEGGDNLQTASSALTRSTPTGDDANNIGRASGDFKSLSRDATEAGKLNGSLNPDWVETLMGYPVGYTRAEGEPSLELPNVWPAGLGAEQYEWEPPRLTTEKTHRASRLKALGNSIVPQVARLWLAAIIEEGGDCLTLTL